MTKTLLSSLLLSGLAAMTACADLIWYEPFNYADGAITNVSGGVWAIQSTGGSAGTPPGNDAYVVNHRLEISGNSSTNAPRQADVNRRFCTSACVYTNGAQIVYASFTINCTNLPTTVSNYIAHFITYPNTQQGRVFSMIGTLPGTWRLGISGASGGVSAIYPADLAPNVDYQVVVCWDPATTFSAKLWINPVSDLDIFAKSVDAVASPTIVQGYAFRQAGGTTSFFAAVTNLAVATTFDEAATNVWSRNPLAPLIVTSPQGTSKFVGDTVTLTTLAAGQNQGGLTYRWRRNGGNVSNPNGNTNVFTINNAAIGDSGTYDVVVTTTLGQSSTSAGAVVSIINPPIPPSITQQPAANTLAYAHQNVTLHVGASGPPTLTYAWSYNNGPVGPNVTGDGTDTITITDVQTANGTAGSYYVTVSNPYGSTNSANAVVTVTNPPAVSIAYLRTLVETTTYAATNSTSLWEVTGVVTTFTNLTSANTASYYLQDGTGGLNIFVTFGSTWRPMLGDEVTFVGFESAFQGTLELVADTVNNPATTYTILSNNIGGLPAPKVLSYTPLTTLNDANIEFNYEGSLVMLTNVYFGTNAGAVTPAANASYIVTNSAGQLGYVFFSSINPDTTNQTLPEFAWTVRGPLTQNTNSTGGGRPGYQVTVSKWTDIVTDAPPAVTVTETHSADNTVLSWTAVPHAYSYSVLTATDVNGPYVPVATGLTFTDANASYTINNNLYVAVLRGLNEVPGNSSPALGMGSVVLSSDQTQITANESWSGLTAPATASHIHGPGAAGVNAPVLFPFSGVPAVTTGAISQQTFAINSTQVGYLQSGQLYMNVHTATYPGGEIRAQLLPVNQLPASSQRYFRVVSP